MLQKRNQCSRWTCSLRTGYPRKERDNIYLNKTNPGTGLKFEDVSGKANIGGSTHWKTGTTMADVNGDFWLDIYVCAVSNYKSFNGHNELFINNQDGAFSEKEKEYGLDFQVFSTQAAFFDYDHDGDPDMYLLNHAVHTCISYDRVNVRALDRDELAGDYLFRNEGKSFSFSGCGWRQRQRCGTADV